MVFYARYTEGPVKAGIESSVRSRSDSYDKASAETINGLVQGLSHSPARPLEERSCRGVATLKWGCWFNNHRLLEPLGYISPAEAEANHYRSPQAKPVHSRQATRSASTAHDCFGHGCSSCTCRTRMMKHWPSASGTISTNRISHSTKDMKRSAPVQGAAEAPAAFPLPGG